MSTSKIALIITALLVVVGGVVYSVKTFMSPAAPEGLEAPGMVACTMEAKQCPDGSYVGRGGPKCEFAPCLGAATKN